MAEVSHTWNHLFCALSSIFTSSLILGEHCIVTNVLNITQHNFSIYVFFGFICEFQVPYSQTVLSIFPATVNDWCKLTSTSFWSSTLWLLVYSWTIIMLQKEALSTGKGTRATEYSGALLFDQSVQSTFLLNGNKWLNHLGRRNVDYLNRTCC